MILIVNKKKESHHRHDGSSSPLREQLRLLCLDVLCGFLTTGTMRTAGFRQSILVADRKQNRSHIDFSPTICQSVFA